VDYTQFLSTLIRTLP